jgi:hypothetical protein
MSYESILLSIDDGVARLTLNRPDTPRFARRSAGCGPRAPGSSC